MSTWHAPAEVLARYATAPEVLDDATASSVELHLLGCAACRRAVADATDPAVLEAGWDVVAERIDAPRPSIVERVLRGLGVDESYARLVAATPALRLSALVALVAVVGVAVVAATARGDAGPFLVVAPMVPLALVAAAFAPGANPAGEAATAAPLTGVGLALRRAVAVLVAGLGVLAAGALALPGFELSDAAWVLPALALSLGALALGTWIRVEAAAVGLGALWLAALWAARLRTPAVVEHLAPLAAPGQIVCAALAGVAVAVLVARRDAFATLGRTA